MEAAAPPTGTRHRAAVKRCADSATTKLVRGMDCGIIQTFVHGFADDIFGGVAHGIADDITGGLARGTGDGITR